MCIMHIYISMYRWLRSGECGSFSDAHHHVFCIVSSRSGFQTKLFLILRILVRRSGHVPMRHSWWRAHMIDCHLLIIELFLVIGDVIVLFVIVTIRFFRSEKRARSSLNACLNACKMCRRSIRCSRYPAS